LDAVMLAAAVPAGPADPVLELGAGAGAASLCLATRVDCAVTGVEIDEGLAALANENARANALATRVTFVCADVLDLPPPLKRDFAHVFANPPFHAEDEQASPDTRRARATHDAGKLGAWIEAGLRRTAPRGTFTLILRADRLGEALAEAPSKCVAIFPLWPRAGVEAKRVLVRIRKGVETPTAMLAGLVLHEADGRYTKDANAILRGEGALDLAAR
jgi:tRNA1(Val) A37 N6-methylase TrmN6